MTGKLAIVVYVATLLASFLASTAFGGGNFNSHKCALKQCDLSTTSDTCEYELRLESYATMSKACHECPNVLADCYREDCIIADAFVRHVYTVNRQLPAPQIRVCEGDTVIVKVINELANGESTSIHWHGMHQKNSVYMDGVAKLTQCPILPNTEYEYRFTASQPGTHFYHAHIGMQRGDGIAGAFIVRARRPRLAPHHDLPEHTLVIQDWYKALSIGQAMLHFHAGGTNKADSLIVNGQGPFNASVSQSESMKEQYRVFNVIHNNLYRFRVISNAVMNCPIQIYVDGDHKLEPIATDGGDIEAVEYIDSVVISGGERWDFILSATSKNPGNYWMYFRGLADCLGKQTLAIVHYDNAVPVSEAVMTDQHKPTEPPSDMFTINPFNEGMIDQDSNDNNLIFTELRSLATNPMWLTASIQPDHKEYLQMGLHKVDNPHFNIPKLYPCWTTEGNETIESPECTVVAQINAISGKLPEYPYLDYYENIAEEEFCDLGTQDDEYCNENYCQCIHRLKVDIGDVVELILIDRGKYFNISNHPIHLHGQSFYILAQGQQASYAMSVEEVRELDLNGSISRNFDRPIKKDNVMLPTGGYVVIRFQTVNPGPWLLHCHNELHVEQGMLMVVEVGEPAAWPKGASNYPCGPDEPLSENGEQETPKPTTRTGSISASNTLYAQCYLLSSLLLLLL